MRNHKNTQRKDPSVFSLLTVKSYVIRTSRRPTEPMLSYGFSILNFLPSRSLERDFLKSAQGFFVGKIEKHKIDPSVFKVLLSQKRAKNVILDILYAVQCVAASATSDVRYYCSIHITFFNSLPTAGGARVGVNMPRVTIVPTLQQRHWFGLMPNKRCFAASRRAALSRLICALTFKDMRAFANALPFAALLKSRFQTLEISRQSAPQIHRIRNRAPLFTLPFHNHQSLLNAVEIAQTQATNLPLTQPRVE